MKRLFLYISSLLLLLFFTMACSSDGCTDNSSAIPKAVFYQNNTQATFKALTVKGIDAPGDSLLVDSAATTQVYLPLRINSSTVKWVLNYHTTGIENDTLTLNYEAIPQFVSRDCGAMFFFHITTCSYTGHFIDHIVITDSLITNIDRTYLQIHMQSGEGS